MFGCFIKHAALEDVAQSALDHINPTVPEIDRACLDCRLRRPRRPLPISIRLEEFQALLQERPEAA